MTILKKFLLNFGRNAFLSLGTINYIILLFNFLLKIKKIFRLKKLTPLDNTFNKISINYNKKKYFINISKLNKLCSERDTFGLIREIFFRNVYLKNFNVSNFNKFICIDLGSNRGIFSLMASKIFKTVICVELQSKYNKCVHEIMLSNHQKNYKIINGVIGELGMNISNKLEFSQNKIDINQLIKNEADKHKVFLKIDIEGGEFKLFEEINLDLVEAISMELHKGGDIDHILDKIKNKNFFIECFNDQLEKINYQSSTITFIKARKIINYY